MIQRKAKIAFITSSLTSGGAERNTINLALNLPHRSYITDVVSIFARNDYVGEYKKNLKKLRIQYLLPYDIFFPPLYKFIFAPYVFIRLIVFIKQEKYSLLIASHEYNTFYITVLCGAYLHIPTILVVGNNIDMDLSSKILPVRLFHHIFFPISLRVCNQIVSVSKGVKKQLTKTFKIDDSKIELIYNGVDRWTIYNQLKKNRVDLAKHNNTVITVGRLIERKGHLSLIRIIKYARDQYKLKIKLTIVGEGKQRKVLEKIIREYKLTNLVRIVDNGGSKLYQRISTAQLFALCSYYEGFGNVIIEAMACGLPVISTNCPYGPSEILDNQPYKLLNKPKYAKYGVLVPQIQKTDVINSQEKAYAEMLVNLLRTPKILLNYKNESLKRAKFFTLQRMVKKYDNVIKDTLKQ